MVWNKQRLKSLVEEKLSGLPRMLKEAEPRLVVCQFWHIPWPNFEVFRICLWAREILDGLLGNDLLGFHLQYHLSPP